MLTESQLRQIVPNMKSDKVTAYLPHINDAMAAFGIDTLLRTAAFIAQLAHESGSFVWMKELWGPTDAQRRYEPPGSLAARLGNTEPGDGKRYMGRGPIQLTGRSNYKRFGDALGLDLIGNPDQAATPEVGFRTAGLYWKSRDINAAADADDIVEVTRRVNGGTNGLADRTAFYERAKQVLAEGFVANPVSRGAARSTSLPVQPLDRGREADAAPVWAVPAAAPTSTPAVSPAAAKPVAPPSAPKKPAAKKAAAKKPAAKKPAAKKPVAKKPAATKAAAKKPAATKSAARKPVTGKPVAKKAALKHAAGKKAVGKKAVANRAVATKAPAKKAAATRAPAKAAAGKAAAAKPRSTPKLRGG